MSKLQQYQESTMTDTKRYSTVDIIDPKLNRALTELAKKNGTSIRNMVNEYLTHMVEKEIFMENFLPKLRKLEVEKGHLQIWDKNRRLMAEVGLKQGIPFCDLCQEDNCPHVIFTMAQEELGILGEIKKTNNDHPKITKHKILQNSIKLEVKGKNQPIILDITSNHDGNILCCNHCDESDCYFRNFVLENEEFWDFLKKHAVKARRVRD